MMQSPELRVLIYARQSRERPGEDERTSLSIRSQEDNGRKWAASRGGAVVGVITDHDLRGADPNRPGIQELIAAVTRERANTLWMLALSRLARDVIYQLMLCRDLEKAGIVTMYSEVEGSLDNHFMRTIYGAMNEQSTHQQKVHLKAAFARRARDGGFPTGPTPIGYTRPHRITVHRANGTSYERATGEPAIDPDGAAFVRDLFARFDAGESLHAIAGDLARAGPGVRGGQWVPSTVKKMLRNAIFVGDITHGGHVVAHNDAWQIVDRDLWERVQARLDRGPVIIRHGVADHWLEGLVWHGCGQRMYYQVDRRDNRGAFGCRTCWEPIRCDVTPRMMSAAKLAAAVVAQLINDVATRPPLERALQMAQERAGGMDAVRRRAAIERARADATARWRRNHERFSAGKLPPAVMDAEDVRLADAERAYAVALASLPIPPDPAAFRAAYARMTQVAQRIADAPDDRKRVLLESIGHVRVGGDDPVGIVYR